MRHRIDVRLNQEHLPLTVRKWMGDSIGRWEGARALEQEAIAAKATAKNAPKRDAGD